MLTRLKNRIVSVVSVFSILASSLAFTPAARAESEQWGRGLAGVWWVNVSVFDCTTLASKGKFTSMLLFARDGTLTETTSNPGFLPGQRSVGFGTWSAKDDGTYSASDVAFILFAGGPFQQGTQKLVHSITLNNHASQWTDQATVDFYTAAGVTIAPMHACATATANRLR